jgi:glucosyl-dolichyl phosphate glucuronosyltransferase
MAADCHYEMDRPADRPVSAMTQPAQTELRAHNVAAAEPPPVLLTVSIIIASKNRPDDLAKTIESLLHQTVRPLEVFIVDQSPTRSVTKEFPSFIRYIHDPAIRGANAARNVGMDLATGDVILFLDDDVELEPNFIHELLSAYSPDVAGVSGIITNYQPPSVGQQIWDSIFLQGIFRDPRHKIYWRANALRDSPPIPVDRFTGCLMSLRSSVVGSKRWDSNLIGGSSQAQDDLDFLWSLPRNGSLVIAPRARLTHHRTPTARLKNHWLYSHAQVNCFMWQRHWRKGLWSRICFAWLNVGYGLAALVSILKRGSLSPLQQWREGARRGKELAHGLS